MQLSKALPLAFSCLSLAFSRLSCSVSFLICSISSSIPRTGRQLRVDKNCRHRGSDENDAPLLLELEVVAGDGDVVIGGEQGDQAEGQAADGLGDAEAIEACIAAGSWRRFWRSRRLLSGGGWRIGSAAGRGHRIGGQRWGAGLRR